MGLLSKKIKEQVKSDGSKKSARQNAEKWYTKALKSFNDKGVSPHGDLRFTPGKIYVFRYDTPKGIDTLPWWDRNPIVLALNPVGKNDCGINLNLLPVPIKEQMLDAIYTSMQGQIKTQETRAKDDAIHQKNLTLKYESAKKYLDKYNCSMAIRQYIPELKTKQAVVSYENWDKIILCDFAEMQGTSVKSVVTWFNKTNKANKKR